MPGEGNWSWPEQEDLERLSVSRFGWLVIVGWAAIGGLISAIVYMGLGL